MKLHGPLLFFLCAPALAAQTDVIHRIDGQSIPNVEVLEESLAQVTYKAGSGEKELAADQVLWVEYKAWPKGLQEAVASLEEEDWLAALDGYEVYVEEQIENPRERRKWAPAAAAFQTVELSLRLGELDGASKNASRLIKTYPNSRYVPAAYLAKARAENMKDNSTGAQDALREFEQLIGAKALSKRWEYACKIAKVESDPSMSPDAARRALRDLERQSASFGTVQNRARVAQGEVLLRQAEKDIKQADQLRTEAKGIFEKVIGGMADEETLAGAYAGLGECLFYAGAGAGDARTLEEAAMAFLRVIILYEAQTRYVPRSLYFAMRCFDLTEDRRRKRDMYVELMRIYPDSRWAAEAEQHK